MLLKFKNKKSKLPRLQQDSIVAVLDIGASKIICLIARYQKQSGIELLGMGYQASKGIEYGQIIDMEAASNAIASTINEAEKMAHLTLDSIMISLAGAYLTSELSLREVRLNPAQPVSAHEISRLYTEIQALPSNEHYDLIHINPIHFAMDGLSKIKDPRGMCGLCLKGLFHMMTAQKGPLKNLFSAVENAHLEPNGLYLSAIASGESCLSEDERQLGVTLIDIGASVTDIVVFYDGAPIFVKSINLGGMHITRDIAAGLGASLEEAERLKTLHGSAIIDRHDHLEMLQISRMGNCSNPEVSVIPKSALTHIIQPRFEEIFELVSQTLQQNAAFLANSRNIILTGGGSELNGVKELAQTILKRSIRLATPLPLQGLGEAVGGARFSVAIGMLKMAFANLPSGSIPQFPSSRNESHSFLKKACLWVKENL